MYTELDGKIHVAFKDLGLKMAASEEFEFDGSLVESVHHPGALC
jgi:hypothetical protein